MKPYALIATGNHTQAKRYHDVLYSLGFQVQMVTTGARAQVQLAFTSPDLIVLDMNLPDMPGEVVLRQVSAQRRLDTTALILLSTEGIDPGQDDRQAPAHKFNQQINPETLVFLASGIASSIS